MHVAVGGVVELDEVAMKKKQKPFDLATVHKLSFKNLETVGHAARCGCFYCYAFFAPDAIKEWADDGLTALCPKCGTDSVLDDKAVKLDRRLIQAMYRKYFGDAYTEEPDFADEIAPGCAPSAGTV